MSRTTWQVSTTECSHCFFCKLSPTARLRRFLTAGCKRLLERLPPSNSDATVGAACLLYKEGNYDEARKLFATAVNTAGYQPELAYNIALCYYQLKQYGPALKHIADIIERGVREHPELSVGAAADGADVRSVGNSQVCKTPLTCIILLHMLHNTYH